MLKDIKKTNKTFLVNSMRFVPYTETDTEPWNGLDSTSDSNTDNNSDFESQSEAVSNCDTSSSQSVDLNQSKISSLEDSLASLPDLTADSLLDRRFKLALTLAENRPSLPLCSHEIRSSGVHRVEGNNAKPKEKDLSNRCATHDLTTYFVSSFADERRKRKTVVDDLIKQEEDRLRALEEERRRKEEELKRKREEEEKRKKEELERKAREEAERKRLEEEKKKKEIEAERKRVEEEQQRQQELVKQRELEAKRNIEEKKKAEETRLKREQEEAKNVVFKPAAVESSFSKYLQDIKDIEATILNPVKENKELKKLVGSHKRKINPKFGQLTNSQQQLTRITGEIQNLIDQTQQNNLAYKWILNFVSDAIISQAETEVSVKPKSSLPLAKLTMNLLILYKDLSYFLLAKFYRSCPYLLGYSCSHETEQGRIRLGWNRDESNGKWENEVQYNERLCGITTLYSVLTRLQLDHSYVGYDPATTKHPLPIKNSWILLARLVDLPSDQLSETHYSIVGAWWDACAKEFLMAYGRQGTKLLHLVSNQWTSIDGKSSAGRVRLKLLAEEWSQGKMSSFPGMEA